jgi:hypothetical protein
LHKKHSNADTPGGDRSTYDVSVECIDNLALIRNGLFHNEFEIKQENPSHFRIARESHLVLYRAMIETLRGSSNIVVTMQRPEDKPVRYQAGDEPWMEIHKQAVPGCHKAWRYSQPKPSDPPPEQGLGGSRGAEAAFNRLKTHLSGFYSALAMIQTGCFREQYADHSQVVEVSDDEMQTLEWLHENIRNEYEHFVPKFYGAPAEHLKLASILALNIASKGLFRSGNVLFLDTEQRAALEAGFDTILKLLMK